MVDGRSNRVVSLLLFDETEDDRPDGNFVLSVSTSIDMREGDLDLAVMLEGMELLSSEALSVGLDGDEGRRGDDARGIEGGGEMGAACIGDNDRDLSVDVEDESDSLFWGLALA